MSDVKVEAKAREYYSRDEWVTVSVGRLEAIVRGQLGSTVPIERQPPRLDSLGLTREEWEIFKGLADRAFAEWERMFPRGGT